MGTGYRITRLDDPPALVVRFVLPPRLDIERLFDEVAAEIDAELANAEGRLYRINDLSLFDHVPIFSLVVRGLAHEVQRRPGSSSDPRLIPVFVGAGRDARLIVDALKQEQYGSWDVPLYPTLEEALAALREQGPPG